MLTIYVRRENIFFLHQLQISSYLHSYYTLGKIQRYFRVIYITQHFYTCNSFSAASSHDICSKTIGVNDELPHSSFLSDNLWLNQCVQLLENCNIHA